MADIVVDGKTRVAYVPACAALGSPTTAEANAGTLLHSRLLPTGLVGFESSSASVDNTKLDSVFDTSLPGRVSWSNVALILSKDDGSPDTIFNLLTTPGTNFFLFIRDGVDAAQAWAAADKLEVYPMRNNTHTMQGRGEANSLLRFQVPVNVTLKPNLKAVMV